MVSKAKRASNRRYDAKHERLYRTKLFDTKDGDLIAWLDEQESVSRYLRQLVREDYERKHQTADRVDDPAE